MSTTWRFRLGAVAAVIFVVALAACNSSGLSNQPRATFSQIGCLDVNHDHRLNDADAADLSKVPDFNGDRKHDAQDAAFLKGIDIELDPKRQDEACAKKSDAAPEYLVAHGYFEPSNVSCDSEDVFCTRRTEIKTHRVQGDGCGLKE